MESGRPGSQVLSEHEQGNLHFGHKRRGLARDRIGAMPKSELIRVMRSNGSEWEDVTDSI